MNKQELNGQELSQEEMKAVNGGSGLFDGLPIIGDLLGSGGNDRNNDNNNNNQGSGNQRNNGNGGLLDGLLGGVLG